MKQMAFSFCPKIPREFGGALLNGKRKAKRPLSIKVPIHLTLRTEKGKLLRFEREIFFLARTLANRYKITIYKQAVLGNHAHFLINIPSPNAYRAWIRRLTSAIANLFHLRDAFFSCRPYTRLLSWGREFRIVARYVEINILEACGISRARARVLLSGNYRLEFGFS